jgi:hypothetical protein
MSVRKTRRPVILNAQADAVLPDVNTYEKHPKASNLAQFLKLAEADIAAGRTRAIRAFFREFKHTQEI